MRISLSITVLCFGGYGEVPSMDVWRSMKPRGLAWDADIGSAGKCHVVVSFQTPTLLSLYLHVLMSQVRAWGLNICYSVFVFFVFVVGFPSFLCWESLSKLGVLSCQRLCW